MVKSKSEHHEEIMDDGYCEMLERIKSNPPNSTTRFSDREIALLIKYADERSISYSDLARAINEDRKKRGRDIREENRKTISYQISKLRKSGKIAPVKNPPKRIAVDL